VDQRLDLMVALASRFDLEAAGTAPEVAERFTEAGFHFHYYPLSRTLDPLSDLQSLAALVRLTRRLRPDIVHAYATKPSVWARIAARLAGTPVVVGTLPGLGSLFTSDRPRVRATRWAYLQLQRLACGWSDLTVFQNENDRAEFVRRRLVSSRRSTVIIGSGVDTDRFRPRVDERRREAEALRSSLGIGPDSVVVSMISRVIRPKGVQEYAGAAERTHLERPGTTFLLVGPDDRDSVDRLAENELRELSHSVRWLGERDDVGTILAASDVFVLPSYYREGVPRVLMEAAASGLPIVTTDAPGCESTVEEGRNGFLVPPRDVGALVEAIRRLVDDPELRRRFGEASRDLAVDRFDLAIVATRTAEHYWRLLEQRGGRTTGDGR
jgi:glycosyltransferase involved in cell wall biosynthesis